MRYEFLTGTGYCLRANTGTGSLGSLESAVKPIQTLTETLLPALLSVVTTVAILYCVFLGLKLAKAEEPQDREKAKGAIKNAMTGYLLIFVLIMVFRSVDPVLQEWVLGNDTQQTETGKGQLTGAGESGLTQSAQSPDSEIPFKEIPPLTSAPAAEKNTHGPIVEEEASTYVIDEYIEESSEEQQGNNNYGQDNDIDPDDLEPPG